MAGTIFVSGGSGYIAGFLIRQLIGAGWAVNTSIRNLAREDEVRGWLDVDNSRLKFFAADLMSDVGWAEAMAGCSHVAHLASPIPLAVPKDPDDIIVPAREGALRALRFAKAAGVKRFVLTSSMAAIAYGHGADKTLFTEADWSNLNDPSVMPYPRSKTVAERAARDWMAAEGGDMEFATVNPSAVLGPLLGKDFSASLELVKKLLSGEVPLCPDIGFGLVDVRDIADLHFRALTAAAVSNDRYVGSGPFLKMIDIAQILKDNMGEKARKVPIRRMPDWLLKILAMFVSDLSQLKGELGRIRGGDSSHAEKALGWKMRPVEETIVDTANSLIANGVVKI